MTITFSIRNVTSDLVNKVMLRKFFQMVFIGNDKKSLHIYTATILGASNCEESNESEKFLSDLEMLTPFCMHFEFAVGNNDSNEVLSIVHEDLTDTDHGFLKEIDCIRKVWGPKCKVISGDQTELIGKLKKIYDNPDKEFTDDEKNITAELTKHKILWTEQKKNDLDPRLLQSLSVAGQIQSVENNGEIDLRDGVFMRKAYSVSVPQELKLLQGIELVNWVRTTINFKYDFDDPNLNYIIKKDSNKDGEKEGKVEELIFAPDFTWYFSPIVKSFIDNRNCMVEIKRGKTGGETVCTCPLQNQQHKFYTSDKFQNSIDSVPNKLTVNFHYWKEEEKINSRQKYRLAAKDVLPNPKSFSDISEISIFLDTADEHNRGNRQFILGLFISFALSFGIDSGRLREISYCFTPLNRVIPEDLCWILFLILFSLSLMNKPAKLSENSRKTMRIRKIAMGCSLFWIFMVYGVFRSPLLQAYVGPIKNILGSISGGMLIIIYGIHLYYLQRCKVDTKDSLWVDLFGEDIL